MSAQPDRVYADALSGFTDRRLARAPAPVPVELLVRAFPVIPPLEVGKSEPFPKRVLIADVVIGPDGRAICGAYLGDGPDFDEVAGRFLGPAAPADSDAAGPGPLRGPDNFLDRLIWRLIYKSRFGFVGWDPAAFFSSMAFAFRHGGLWAVIFTDEVNGRQLVDYHRSPVILGPLSDGRVSVRFGPRKKPDPGDFGAGGRQYPGRFTGLQDAVSAFTGERVKDLATACRLFDVAPPPPGLATVEALHERIVALRKLYRAVRAEAESWPGVVIDRLPSATALVSGAYITAGIQQPLLRDRRTVRVPPRAIGAGIEAASIGARTGTFVRRQAVPGLDVDIAACYPVANALADVQDLLTHEVVAHHLRGCRSLSPLRRGVADAVAAELLDHPEAWQSLAFLAKVRPAGDALTVHVDLFGTEATITAPIVSRSREFWTTGFDLAAAVIEDLDRGGAGHVPEITEAWTFTFGRRLRGLRPVMFPGGWTWDPRRVSTYRSRDGRTRGNIYLLLAAMRAEAKSDPSLTPAQRIRRRGMLKVAANAGAFGMFSATTARDDVKPGTAHRLYTSDGIVSVRESTAERPGPWAFPLAAALVEGGGRLLLSLLLHEVRGRGGTAVQVDTDGGFIIATPNGSRIDQHHASTTPALSFAEVQEVRDRFVPVAEWAGLPTVPNRVEGGRLVGGGRPSLLKIEDTIIGPGGLLRGYLCYAPGVRRFAIHPAGGDGPWRVSENTIGAMVNPTSLRSAEFARECYRYLLAREADEPFETGWLDEPVLWPKTLTHPADLTTARRAIPGLRLTESVVYVRDLFGTCSYIARRVPGASWQELDWRSEDGHPAHPVPARETAVGAVRTWRAFLNTFLSHPVAFTLDADGRRADGDTRGVLHPAPILIVGAAHTGRTRWGEGERAETLLPDPNEWARVLGDLAGVPGAELSRAGLAPRTARAIRAGRRPVRRNAEAAYRLVAKRARADAGLVRDPAPQCAAPGCTEHLTGRQRTFCARHGTYPGARRKAWIEATAR